MKSISEFRDAGYECIQERDIQYIKAYGLSLNSILHNREYIATVAIAPTYGDMINWYNEQLADEPWEEEIAGEYFRHAFKAESILRDYYPPLSLEVGGCDAFMAGIRLYGIAPSVLGDDIHIISHKE